ncbi:hypothetical protein [Demequina sp. NBRC 110052]|uniref:hypothetical protein n=1 Tax=Demequina sp. NBRC 110052 TaxID=1570341 RepID=UPI0009FDE4CA|nr:hypothetical protein [Demequina sp. NBRC 110052]
MGTSRSDRSRARAKRDSASAPALPGDTATETLDADDGGLAPETADDFDAVETSQAPTPDAAETPDHDPDGSPYAPSRRHDDAGLLAALRRMPRERTWWIVAVTVLAIATTVMAVLVYQMVGITEEWEQRSNEIDAANYELGQEIADANTTITQQTDRITLLTQQLDTAKTRISELADQTANFDDDRAYMAQQIDLLSGYVGSASSVANALGRCVDGQKQLVEYVKNAEDYEPQELLDYENSVNELCKAAQDSNAALQAQLSE